MPIEHSSRRKIGAKDPVVYYLYGNDNHGVHRVAYALKVWMMTDAELLRETESKIWLSAYANNNPRSDYHWHVDTCFDEWVRRDKEDQYTVAFNAAKRSEGY